MYHLKNFNNNLATADTFFSKELLQNTTIHMHNSENDEEEKGDIYCMIKKANLL